jgi:hypothetical protein
LPQGDNSQQINKPHAARRETLTPHS